MLNDLKNRGVQGVLFFCVDELLVFKEAMGTVYPDAQIQRCIIRMLHNSFKYVNYSNLKQFSSDFKSVYNDPVRCLPCQIWRKSWKNGGKYPYTVSSQDNNWEDISSFFQCSDDIRHIMYTTNIIEGLICHYRKVTKTKNVFPSDSALET